MKLLITNNLGFQYLVMWEENIKV